MDGVLTAAMSKIATDYTVRLLSPWRQWPAKIADRNSNRLSTIFCMLHGFSHFAIR